MRTTPPITEARLLEWLLEEQGQLTAVERFARVHTDANGLPDQARYYRALIPLEAPQSGQQYAFAVDLDRCTGCKACVSACHSLNGLDEHETWRSTGLLVGGTSTAPYQQVVTSACHHCLDPACLNGCPVLAYEKDPLTGIVRHLDDQCIGCQYCVLKCPYDVPQYSSKRGIVRKCDMCHNRLAAEEAPACVQACPSQAISIRVVSRDEVAQQCAAPQARLLPGAISSQYTMPTTAYVSRRGLPANTQPGDHHVVRSEPAHWPLIWMLVLTQLGAGLTLMTFLSGVLERSAPLILQELAMTACVVLHAGLVCSVFHLGKPMGAWRAFLGWRRSWMSREILTFGGFSLASVASVLATTYLSPSAVWVVVGACSFIGLVAVFCSAMIYIDTHRPFWSSTCTLTRFFGATIVLGAAGATALRACTVALTSNDVGRLTIVFCLLALIVRFGLSLWEVRQLRGNWRDPEAPNYRSARVVWSLHKPAFGVRMGLDACATVTGALALLVMPWSAASLATLSFVATFISVIIERYLFFVAVVPTRMPGGGAA